MAKISDLPIEILEHIFDDAATTFSPDWHLKLPAPSRALFPFNVASTCTLWLSVLKSKPAYWRQVVIDVADDPTPFLDTLTLFEVTDEVDEEDELDGYDTARIVIVFSSMKDYTSLPISRHDDSVHEEAKFIENARAHAVFERLEESISDCGSITFDLVYQSSLTSSARLCAHQLPLLRQLTLNCVIHDCDDVPVSCPGALIFCQLDSLKSMSITGVSFMELCDCDLHQIFPLDQLYGLELSINHFIFHEVDQVKTFQRVLNHIPLYATLSLLDLTLTCPASAEPNLYIFIGAGHLSFDSLSSAFLEEFLPTIFHGSTVQILSFQRCSIPYTSLWNIFAGCISDTLQLLQLIDIPSTADEDIIPNAIYSLTPQHVRLLRCKAVTDRLFKYLACSKCSRIQTLELHDCNGFSSGGVRAFVQARRDYFADPGTAIRNDAFEFLEVYGTGPLLSVDDAAFFLAAESDQTPGTDSSIMHVEWNVVGHNSIPDGYTTDLHPADEVRPILLEYSLDGCPLAQVSKSAMYTIDADASPGHTLLMHHTSSK